MFLYNILTGGSSKQELPKYDKIVFKINLSDNIPQYYECNSSEINKPLQYEEEQEISETHPLYNKIFNQKSKQRKQSEGKVDLNEQKNALLQQTNVRKLSQHIQTNQTVQGSQEEQTDNKQSTLEDQEQISESKTPQHKPYPTYVTTQNDTLFGIALKLDIRQQQIQQLNDISERLYPGMTLKLPYHCDVSKLYEQPQNQLSKVKISELLGYQTQNSLNQTEKFNVEYYAGLAGYINGSLTINNNYIIFNPNLEDPKNLENYSVQKLLKFNAIVQTVDIQNIEFIDIPQMAQSQSKIQNPDHNFIVQIFLYIVGNPKIQKKYKERLNKLKAEKKAIASVSFSLRGYKSEAKEKCQKIVKKVKEIVQRHLLEQQSQGKQEASLSTSRKLRQQKRLTNIPFFDIIHENLHPKMKQQIESMVLTPQKQKYPLQPVSPSLACGILTQTSDIISDQMFHNLSFSLPLLYQQCHWTRIYSSTINGTSFTTFLKKSQDQYPLIMLVKQYKGWKFGAFLCQSLETGKTGRGEMFLFTFKNQSQVPDCYKWTGKNEFFVYIEKDSGIGIGMGMKYGLFVKNTMDKGSSAATVTFGNVQSLSKKEDFIVQDVQLWAVDDSY